MADYEWAQVTLGQNKTIAEIASQASKASALVDANVKFAKVALELGKVLLLAATNPQLLLLVAIADEIDNIVSGDDTPKTKQRATETLSDFVEELIEQTDNELELELLPLN